MTPTQEGMPGALKFAGMLLILTGALHCVAWLISGWNPDTSRLIPFGVAYLLLGIGLLFAIRLVRYLAFLVTLVGILAAWITMDTADVARWLMWIFIAVDAFVLLVLFGSIWRGRQEIPPEGI